MRLTTGWSALMEQWSKDMRLLSSIVFTLGIFRVLLLILFSEKIADESGFTDYLDILWMGLRFDIATACTWILLSFLVSLFVLYFPIARLASMIRSVEAWSFVFVGGLLLFFDIFFFHTYGDHFNQLVFGFFYDDTKAILLTIWKEYHPILSMVGFGFIAFILWRFVKTGIVRDLNLFSHGLIFRLSSWQKAVFILLSLVMLGLLMRGGTALGGPPLTLKHAHVTNDLFLNKVAMNPLTSLRHTVKMYYESDESALEKYWPSKDLSEAARALGKKVESSQFNIDEVLSRKSGAPSSLVKKKPKHIFFILMEGYSGWTMLPQYRDAGFSNGLSKLADKGIYFPNVLPITHSTIDSLNTLVTGMPAVGYYVNQERESLKPYPSSVANIFKQLGYKTRFFYGGFISWRRLDIFLPAQGFDEIYGGGAMSAGTHTNEWGVDDEYLFDFASSKVDDDEPSFNFILSTSNHRPYDIDLEKIGYNIQSLPEGVRSGRSDVMTALGHHWYADKVLAEFMETKAANLSDVVFVVTGDHPARLDLNFPGSNVVENQIVPLVFYGPDVIGTEAQLKDGAAAHIDIIPTLVEMAAPEGFPYISFGRNLFSEDGLSFGSGYLNDRNGLIHISDVSKVYGLPWQSHDAVLPENVEQF
ncbi:MAG: sulfatase-like hydrolase/transferase, partial [Gammaproteobacteria bacterium]|nr:sulfatase-like hydrolase/transferase [Gammaproteobacteria bacterium]